MLFKLILLGCLQIISFQLKSCGINQSLYQGQCIQNSCVEIYIKKFQETTYDSTFLGTMQNSIDIGVDQDSSKNALITISFLDNIEGSTTVDNPISCITPVHNIYSLNHASKTFDFKPNIISKFNNETGKRTWQYSIQQSTYNNTLITAMKNSTHLNYIGFFGIDFNILEYTQITILYSFQATVALQGSNVKNNLFHQLLTHENSIQCQTYNPSINCISSNSTELYFCATGTCESPQTSILLTINQIFWLYIKISEPFYQSYQLFYPTIQLFSGQQLIKVYNPAQTNVNIKPGFTMIQISVDFAYSDISFTVSTTLGPPNQTDLNVSNTISMRMYASSSQISCISSTGYCSTCSQQCLINKGLASSGCQPCNISEPTCPQGQFFNGYNCVETPKSGCDKNYQSRFYTDNLGLYPISFNPQVSFNKYNNPVATISFDDMETDGLMQSDNNLSCIKAEHFIYNENFETKQNSFSPNITSVYMKLNNKRYWVYSLPFLQSSDTDRLLYYGYYGIDFKIEDKILAKLQFSFQSAFSNQTRSVVITNFDQLLACQQCSWNSETIFHLVFLSVLILGI
ncbi:hypothetical protein pb186bvf_000344 [Paramecium bursaria]